MSSFLQRVYLQVGFTTLLLGMLAAGAQASEPRAARLPTELSQTQPQSSSQQGDRLFRQGQFREALAIYQQILTDSALSPSQLGNVAYSAGVTSRILGDLAQAQSYIDQAIALAEQQGNRRLLGRAINEAGVIAYNRSDFDTALDRYGQALAIAQAGQDRELEVLVLDNQGVIYRRQGDYDTALALHQQALSLSESLADQAQQARVLNNIGIVYDRYGQYPEALRFHIQGLAVAREAGDRFTEPRILLSIGAVYINLGDYPQALNFLEQALSIQRETGNRAGEGRSLISIGAVYRSQGAYDQALSAYRQGLNVNRAIGNRIDAGAALRSMGLVYWEQGNYPQALETYQEALDIHRAVGDRPNEGYSLIGVGTVYYSLGEYSTAITTFEQALAIFRDIEEQASTATVLNSLGGTYAVLGQSEQALEFYEQAIAIRQRIGDQAGTGITLNNIGLLYMGEGNHQRALETYQEALEIRRSIGDRSGEATTLNNVGLAYSNLGQIPEAIATYQQALAIHQTVGDPVGEASTLTSLAGSHEDLGQLRDAMEAYRSALALFEGIGNRDGQRFVLSKIGDLLAAQNQFEIAIVFYKQSVNLTEAIRAGLGELPLAIQQTYTATIAATYRQLADLLLQEDRVLEAQRVLELLKVQELDDYLRDVERSSEAAGIPLREAEQDLLERFAASQDRQDSYIAVGRELRQLEAVDLGDRTAEQAQRIRDLRRQQQKARQEFRAFFELAEIQALVQQLRRTTGAVNLELEQLNGLQDNLAELGRPAVILYPLILPDRLELILVTPDSPPIRRMASVSRLALNRTIAEFRSALQVPGHDAKPSAQRLYQWLIAPIEADLQQLEVDIIIYSPDGPLRYVPLAALHSGQQWVAQQWQVNNITAASLDDINREPTQGNPRVLAAAFTEGQHEVAVGDRRIAFNGLTFAAREVELLSQLIPETEQRLDREFSQDIVLDMNDFTIIHLATHATFTPGPPEASFILFGDGSRATLTDIKDWNFPNVELVVLSACETAVGDILQSNGEEVLGFGYLMQQAGAEAAIASLWQVSDGGTQALMDAFYTALSNGYSKAEALQRAQQVLIAGDLSFVVETRGEIAVVSTATGAIAADTLSHPYYWAPFILIGNGL